MSCQLFGMDGGVIWPSAEFTEVTNGTLSQGSLTNPMAGPRPHHAELADFANCVRGDRPSPVPWTETLRVIAILEAIYQSQESGREVEVKASDFPELAPGP